MAPGSTSGRRFQAALVMNRDILLKASLDAMFYSGASHAFRRPFAGMGAIFMLHHVLPRGRSGGGFSPNSGLEITPEFLDAAIDRVTGKGFELVSLEEAVARLMDPGRPKKPFAAFTMDDGYRDNLEYALPVFRKHACPFTIFVSPAISDGQSELWWRGLEKIIASTGHVTAELGGRTIAATLTCDRTRQRLYDQIYWPLRMMPDAAQRRWITSLAAKYGIDLHAMCRSLAMNWDEIRQIASDPLCTIGAHTTNHFALAKLSDDEVRMELKVSRNRIEQELNRPVNYFAYPYGDELSAGPRDFSLTKEAGYVAAVTTRKGMLFEEHRDHLFALPRVTLNGNFQQIRYLDVLLSGMPFAFWNRFNRVSVA